MNISEKIKKIKTIDNDVFIIVIILFVGLISFGLGRLSALSENKTPVTVRQGSLQAVENLTGAVANTQLPASPAGGSTSEVNSSIGGKEKLFVASKNGTKYHYPWCSGAQSIKEENKIWFDTKEEAEKAGYTPASNCKGL